MTVNKRRPAGVLVFISHMVQIKPAHEKPRKSIFADLYIPHGSDKTFPFYFSLSQSWKLYIPHGSDKTQSA